MESFAKLRRRHLVHGEAITNKSTNKRTSILFGELGRYVSVRIPRMSVHLPPPLPAAF